MSPTLIMVLFFWTALSDCRQLSTSPSDITSINSLGERTPITLDPKLRRALIRVLSRLEMEDPSAQISDQEFFNIFGEEAKSEDLGSIESSAESIEQPQSPPGQHFDTGHEEKHLNDQQQDQNYQNQNNGDSNPSYRDQNAYQEQNNIPQGETYQQNMYPEQSFTPHAPTYPEQGYQDKETSNQESQVTEVFNEESPKGNEEDRSKQESRIEESKDVGGFRPAYGVEDEVSIGTTVSPSTALPSSTTSKPSNKSEVEFFHAPLIAAFTVQQDGDGIPRRVIPLQYQDRLQEERRLADQSVFSGTFLTPSLDRLRQEAHARELEIQRLRKAELLRAQQLERFRYQEEERRRLEEQERQRLFRLQQESRYNTLDLQKSVDIPFFPHSLPVQAQFVPGIELNRIHRHEPQSLVANPGFNQPYHTQSSRGRHLENLLIESGVPPREDLNIVTKVLALDHTRFPRTPSRLIEPPRF